MGQTSTKEKTKPQAPPSTPEEVEHRFVMAEAKKRAQFRGYIQERFDAMSRELSDALLGMTRDASLTAEDRCMAASLELELIQEMREWSAPAGVYDSEDYKGDSDDAA